MRWTAERVVSSGGRFRTVIHRPGFSPVDVSYFRDVPVIPSYTSADPFSDATAVLSFPQLTAYEDLAALEVGSWLSEDSNVDIWWVPAMPIPPGWVETNDPDSAIYRDPVSEQPIVIAPGFVWQQVNGTWVRTKTPRGTKVWEGFITSLQVSSNGSADSITAQCLGALFQADGYLAKPFFPPRPQTLESLILGVFDHSVRPHLRTSRPVIAWPSTWTYLAPSFTGPPNVFTPNVRPGTRWTGYTTRQTGSWDHSLTSFVQSLLANMLVKDGSGVAPGNQWTLTMSHQGHAIYPAGRTPVLRVRDRFRTPDFAMWAGTRGLTFDLTGDATQRADTIYGSGTDLAGTSWNNLRINTDGSRTDYAPIVSQTYAYPTASNKQLDTGRIIRESYVQFGAGFSEPDATDSGEQMLARDSNTGWSGTVTLTSDPPGMSRWTIVAGMTMALQGYLGTGATGLRLHIAQVEADPAQATVTLTVDTRYRDLLTLNEAIERTRDALTPAKLLEINKNSVTIEDIQAPWNYNHGSGFIPSPYVTGAKHRPSADQFPYLNWVKAYPPRKHPQWYVACHANSTQPKHLGRWAGPIRILMAEKGTIRRTEVAVFDIDGNLLKIPFHMSLYYKNGINASFMPHAGYGSSIIYSPFIPYAFSSIDPTTGAAWATPGHEADSSLVQGFGNKEQPAGYSPGYLTEGDRPTGLLVDENTWTFDCSANNPNYQQLAPAGKESAETISVYAMFYADYTEPVYFQGRLYRMEPGTDGS